MMHTGLHFMFVNLQWYQYVSRGQLMHINSFIGTSVKLHKAFMIVFIWAETKQKEQVCMSAQRRLRSDCANAQFDQSLRKALYRSPGSRWVFILTAKTLIRPCRCAYWFESWLCAYANLCLRFATSSYHVYCLFSLAIPISALEALGEKKLDV